MGMGELTGVGPEEGRGSARNLNAGREEEEKSITTKLVERDGGLRIMAGMVEGRTHRRNVGICGKGH